MAVTLYFIENLSVASRSIGMAHNTSSGSQRYKSRHYSASNKLSKSREISRMGSANSNSSGSSRNSSGHKSLNFEIRKRESEKIREENFNILNRLKQKKSVYNVS